MAEFSDTGKIMIISSDGHATARMEDYTDYLDPAFRDEFRGKGPERFPVDQLRPGG